MADANKVTVDLTTGIGTLSFPRVFQQTAVKNDKGETVYDVQFLIPKTDRESVIAILTAIKTVGEAKWGDKWKRVKHPLRDGDKEADDLTEDGSTKGDKYPERKGHFFINARSSRPVTVVGRDRVPILDADQIYAGVKAKINVGFYPYSNSGNHGIGCGLNGIQKISDGDPIGGGGKPSVESMFDMLEDDDDTGFDDFDIDAGAEPEETPAPAAKKAAAKKAPAKKAAAKPAPEPEEIDADDLGDGDDDDDLFADLDV